MGDVRQGVHRLLAGADEGADGSPDFSVIDTEHRPHHVVQAQIDQFGIHVADVAVAPGRGQGFGVVADRAMNPGTRSDWNAGWISRR